MIRIPYEAGGFAFPDEKMMEKAVKEGEGIRYIRNSADMNNPRMVFQVYCQMVSQRLFETPVGYAYLFELQEYLKANPAIRNQDIPSIPVASCKAGQEEGFDGLREVSEPKRRAARETKEKNINYKPWFKASITVSIILFFIVVGMFAVTATSGNVNILNYENALIEKYENWEARLNEREEKLKEWEKELNRAKNETENLSSP